MNLAIRGLGTALPGNPISQDLAAAINQVLCCQSEEHKTVVATLFRHTGIRQRHMVLDERIVRDILDGTTETNSPFLPRGLDEDHGPTTQERMRIYNEAALPLAVQAAQKALYQASIAPETLTHLVTVSCTGFSAPGVDTGLMKALHLSPVLERTHVGFMGCHGAINGMRVARAYTGSDPEAKVLLCAVELCSLHYHYGWDPKKIVANSLFADGAAALVGVSGRHGAEGLWRITATGSCLLPQTEYAMTWDIGDHGFEMTLSTKVPDLIAKNLRPWLVRWLDRQGVSLEAIGSWAVHPGGPRILSAVEEGLGLGPDALAVSRAVLADCGNMSSPTVLFILERLQSRQAPLPCVVLGFGPGLVAEAALIE
ncbi:MAG TPA: type III polyketide synthase [Gemmataceae bacterium]|nr:type III polyketide synthase [Gemmataceae bacterium]